MFSAAPEIAILGRAFACADKRSHIGGGGAPKWRARMRSKSSSLISSLQFSQKPSDSPDRISSTRIHERQMRHHAIASPGGSGFESGQKGSLVMGRHSRILISKTSLFILFWFGICADNRFSESPLKILNVSHPHFG